MKLILGAAIAALVAVSANATTTLDFEGGTESVGTLAGVTFIGAEYFACSGGCPAPAFGHFISGAAATAAFTTVFATAQTSVSFVNVTFSSVTATAYDAANLAVATLTDITGDTPNGPLTLSGAGIRSVVFADAGIGYGIDDLTFDDAPVVASIPEPSSWALLAGGFALTGAMLRLRARATQLA